MTPIQSLYKDVEPDSLTLWYKGIFEDRLTEDIIELTESGSADPDSKKSGKKIPFLMAESFQNIIRHGLKDDGSTAIEGTFGISNRNGMFHIYSSNLIPNDEAGKIESKLQLVNNLGPEELKAYYQEVLSVGALSSKGGAGLGLIEMARKSGRPLQFQFSPKGNLTEFVLQIDHARTDRETDLSIMPIQQSISFSAKLSALGVRMFFKGDFKTDAANSMLSMLAENVNLGDDESGLNKKIYHSGVELLQNISRHGGTPDGKAMGMFILSASGNYVTIATQNFSNEAGSAKLEKHLQEINAKSPSELNIWYRKKLKQSALDDSNSAGVGLIDVGRLTLNPMNFATENVNGMVLCTIIIRIKIGE